MNTNSLCPSCRNAIPADAPGGLCPACALMGAAQPTVVLPFASMPSREEVAAAFPDLEVMEVLGQGGMGIVFKARQPRLDRLVALKILPPALAQQPGFPERFTREARALAKLNHANIVTVHDFGTSGGFFYLLMEYVNGVNLRKAMQAGIKPEQAMLLVPRICEALQFAHDHGVLHRDIKPENILLDTSGTPKLADFGIAKLAGENASGLTLSGVALGTAAYMAPEQIEKPATVDHRADIYSLGVVFYEMLTGELPLGRFASPSEKSNVGESVDRVVMRALEKERDRRQQSATEMKTQVESVTSDPRPIMPRMEEPHRPQGPVKHLLQMLTVLCAIGIPASGALHIPGLTPQMMVFATIAMAVIAGMWPAPVMEPNSRFRPPLRRREPVTGPRFELRSRRVLFGLPLYHIVRGYDPATGIVPVARGIVAMGQVAKGFVAMGGRAHGVIAMGGLATGVLAIGGISIGVFSTGGFALGLLCALGGMAVGTLVLGGGMAGVALLAGNPHNHLTHGRMLLGPLVDPLGPYPDMLRRCVLIPAAFVVLMSLIVLIAAAFAGEGQPRPHNPWPRRAFFLIFFSIAIPATALLPWSMRRAESSQRMSDNIHWKRATYSTDGNRSEALWEATSPSAAWLTLDAGTGPQAIELRPISTRGRQATLGITVEGNQPQPGWMKVTCFAQNWDREINSTGYFRMVPGVTGGNVMTLKTGGYDAPLSSGPVFPLLRPEAGKFTVTFSTTPDAMPEDNVTVTLRDAMDTPDNRIVLDCTHFTRGDCRLFFRTTGNPEPSHTVIAQLYSESYFDMHRYVWTLPDKVEESARKTAVESLKKTFAPENVKLSPGQETRLVSIPVPGREPIEIFLGARFTGLRNSSEPQSQPVPVQLDGSRR